MQGVVAERDKPSQYVPAEHIVQLVALPAAE